MSPVALDLVTIKEPFVHRAAGLSADVNKEQLVNVATGPQYARPVRPGQFSVRGLRTGWDHRSTQAAPNQILDLWVSPSGTSGQKYRISNILQMTRGTFAVNKMSPCNNSKENPFCLMCNAALRSRESSNRDLNIPNGKVSVSFSDPASDETDRLITWLTWENGHLPADEMKVLSRQHQNYLVFFGTWDHGQGDSNGARKTAKDAAKMETNRQVAQPIYRHIFMFKTCL